jgi:DNA-binding protein H-NS
MSLSDPRYQELLREIEKTDQVRAKLNQELEELKKAAKSKAIESINAEIAKHGILPSELKFPHQSNPAKKETKPERELPARYQDPVSGETWHGKGKHPDWLRKALEDKTKTKEDFLIVKS